MLNLIVVYLVWGSTYLFIRLTVQEGSGFPPFAMAASRTLCASAILFILAVVFGHRLRVPGPELRVLIASGLLLWVGGNGLVVWAERHADSGYAALVIGTTPMWPVLMESILERKPPSLLLALSLLVGFSGLAVLVVPVLKQGLHADVFIDGGALGGGHGLVRRVPAPAAPTSGEHSDFDFGLSTFVRRFGADRCPAAHRGTLASPDTHGLAGLGLSGHCRLVDQLHLLYHCRAHPAHFRGHDLRLYQPGHRRPIGLAGVGGTHHLLHGSRDGPDPYRGLRCFLETVRTRREIIRELVKVFGEEETNLGKWRGFPGDFPLLNYSSSKSILELNGFAGKGFS